MRKAATDMRKSKSQWKAEVIGLGKAGLPLAAVIAESGINVIGVDLNKHVVEQINSGENPIKEEPGLQDLIKKYSGRTLTATTDAAAAARSSNVHIVIVPLYIDEKKKPDFLAIIAALQSLALGLKKNDLVVIETTVPVGTTQTLARKILEENSRLSAGRDFHLAFSPERIMTGHSISRFKDFPKIVGGIDDESSRKAVQFYSNFSNIHPVRDAKTAELAKIAEGIYRDVNIALANELSLISEHYGIDYFELKEAASHQYCNLLEPGNVGGHCIPVYPWFIINEHNAPLAKMARNINDTMIYHYALKIDGIVRKKKNANVAVLGLSYREGVKEHAYSRSIPLIKLLRKKGYNVFGADPLYSQQEVEKIFMAKPLDIKKELAKMDAIILMNKERSYAVMLKHLKNKVVDVKRMLG